MKRFVVRRVLPVILSLSIVLPAITAFSFAADFPSAYRDQDSVDYWSDLIRSPKAEQLAALAEILEIPGNFYNIFWALIDKAVYEVGPVSYTELALMCSGFNGVFKNEMQMNAFQQIIDGNQFLLGWSLCELFEIDIPNFVVSVDPETKLHRLKDLNSGLWLVDSTGRYPYFEAPSDSVIEDVSDGDHWVSANEVYKYVVTEQKGPIFVNRNALQAVADNLNDKLDSSASANDFCSLVEIGASGKIGINKPGYFWCNAQGVPYAFWKDDKTATDQDRPVTEIVPEDGSEPVEPEEDFEVGIDFDGMVIYLPDGSIQIIDEVYYNPTTNEYEIKSYDIENNEYNYYTYEYYLQYTYVTYIGETSDFEAYKCYYELPDGRNSADLTKEELEQLSVAIDVVEYSRATDDVRIRALYHFDGSTKDSSYWNHQSKFDWSNTPSITYMDVETFNGALYLDGNVRSTLNMSLPTDFGRGDFTIQFRYYQGQKIEDDAYTGLYLNADFLEDEWSPRTDDTAYQILNFNGSAIGSSALEITKTENYPVGSWFEVCITRQGNVLTYYLNGMPVHDKTISSMAFDKTLTFHFDGGTVAYAMIDELRVLNYAIASGDGSYYEPTAVPHDTNLALVLPEDKVAIADEYWEITSSGNNLLKSRGLDYWTTQWIDTSNALVPLDYNVYNVNGNWNFDLDLKNLISDDLTAYYNTDVIDLDFSSSGTMFDLVYDRPQDYEYLSLTGGFMSLNSGYSVPFSSIYIPISIGGNSVLADDSYVFSVVNGSGAIRTIKFTIKDGLVQTGTSASFGNMRISASRIGSGSTIVSYICIGFNPKTDKVPTQPIVYMELLKGATSTDLKAEFHEDVAILDKDDQFKPTLAVRTDLEITDYQIGGVRPAIPSKGLVYALVQSGYITSLQIYNGQAWEAVDGRIWTGERWIPYSSYNIITLQDMYDISDTTNDYEYIYTETGFWSWWQRSWNEFTGKLFGLLGGGAGDVDLDEPVTESDPENEDDLSFWEFIKLLLNGCKAVFTGARQLFGGVVSTVPEAVSTLTGAFEPGGMAVSFLDGSDPDADAAELRIVSYTIPGAVYNEGDPLEYSIHATGIGLTYQWLTSTDNEDFHVFATKPSFTSSAWGYGHYNVFVKCVVTDYKGNQLSTPVVVHFVEAASTYSLRGFRDVDLNEYYETEVLDPWRYR